MAVVVVKEIIGRDADSTGESGTMQRSFRVEVDSKSDNATTIASSLPAYLEAHPDNIFFTCRSVSLREVSGSWRFWEAVAKYSSEPLTQREKERQISDPLNRDPKIRWDSRDESEPSFVDRRGVTKVNSAGDFYDPPPDVLVSNWTINVEVNVSEVPVAVLDYQNAVNNSSITIDGVNIAQGAARVASISISDKLEENGVTYRVFRYTIETKRPHPSYVGTVLDAVNGSTVTPEPWDSVILDQGMREKESGSGSGSASGDTTLRQITDIDGNFVNSPVMLDGTGHKLENPGPDTAVFFRYVDHNRLDFSVLPGVSVDD